MIMQGTPTRKLSRPGVWLLLGLGALVLPFLPGLGPDQSAAAAPEDPARVAAGAESSEPPAATRGREEARPSPERPVRTSDPRPSAEDLQNARDEVELLEVQLQGKQAELQEMETRIKIAERHRAQMKQLHDKGAVTSELLAKAQDDADLAKAQLQAKLVQVKEAQVRLNQAKRRLARLHSPAPEGRGAAPARTPAKSAATDNGTASRIKRLQMVLKEYQTRLEEKRASSPDEAKAIEEFLQRLKTEIGALEGKRILPGQTERELPLHALILQKQLEGAAREVELKLRKELEGAAKEIEQYKARAEQERQRAQQALAEAEKARALAEEAKARDALKARALEKKATAQQRFWEGALNQARPGERKQEFTPQLKSVEDRLNALAKEMEALRKEIRDLATRPERAPGDKPPTTPKPPAKR